MKPTLRLVQPAPPPHRSSVVVDMALDQPRVPSPWSAAALDAMNDTPIPVEVTVAMYIAAWARAEHVEIVIVDRDLKTQARHDATDALTAALNGAKRAIVASLGFAIPIVLDGRRHARAASWPTRRSS